jgi:type II secretory pathway pseudopilin PulG
MLKIKKPAFTLSETLLTLSVIGVLGALVLPGVIKDSINKANIALLQSTVSQLNDAVQTELVKANVTNIADTIVYKSPDVFLRRTFDVAETCTGATPNSCYANTSTGYKTYSGSSTSLVYSRKAVLLTNGVTIDILTTATTVGENYIPISIDLNGPKTPNVLGVDRHLLCLAKTSDINSGRQVGNVGGCIRPGAGTTATANSTLISKCKSGNTEVCYYLLEQSGFDSNYLEKKY